MFAELEANHTNAKDRDIGTIGHEDKSVRKWLKGFKIILIATHAEETARINTQEILVGGLDRASSPLEELGRERQRGHLKRCSLGKAWENDGGGGAGREAGKVHGLLTGQGSTH